MMADSEKNMLGKGPDKEIFILIKGSYSPMICSDGNELEEEIVRALRVSIPPVSVARIIATHLLSDIPDGISEMSNHTLDMV